MRSRPGAGGPFDPATYTVVVIGLTAVVVAASWAPARRASAVEPIAALRGE